MVLGLFGAVLLALVANWFSQRIWFIFFFVFIPLSTFFYIKARWDTRDCVYKRFKLRVWYPAIFLLLTSLGPILLVYLLTNHPFTSMYGTGATSLTMLRYYLLDFSIFYGGFAIIGIVDEIIGFACKQPINRPPDPLNLYLGPLLLITGIIGSIWGAMKGLPGTIFSKEFMSHYLATLFDSMPWATRNPNWPLIHYAIVCGPFFVLIGIWMILAGVETPDKMGRKFKLRRRPGVLKKKVKRPKSEEPEPALNMVQHEPAWDMERSGFEMYELTFDGDDSDEVPTQDITIRINW